MPHLSGPGDPQAATSRAVIALAARQHGRVATAQLRALGWTDTVVRRRVTAGWLVREHRGAYRLAGAPHSPLARSASAILAVSPSASVTHVSGLAHHGVLPEDPAAPVHLTTPRHHRSRAGIELHQAALRPDEIVRFEGVAVASLVRCLLDVSAAGSPALLAQAVHEAEFLRLLDPAAVVAACEGRKGGAALRDLAADRLPIRGDLRLELERRCAVFLRERHFAIAEVNVRMRLRHPAQVVCLDVLWREAGLALELDGRQAHATARTFETDRERDRRLAVQHGLRVVRVTWRQLRDDRDALEADLKALYARGVAERRAAS